MSQLDANYAQGTFGRIQGRAVDGKAAFGPGQGKDRSLYANQVDCSRVTAFDGIHIQAGAEVQLHAGSPLAANTGAAGDTYANTQLVVPQLLRVPLTTVAFNAQILPIAAPAIATEAAVVLPGPISIIDAWVDVQVTGGLNTVQLSTAAGVNLIGGTISINAVGINRPITGAGFSFSAFGNLDTAAELTDLRLTASAGPAVGFVGTLYIMYFQH